MPTGNTDLDRLDALVEAVAQGKTVKLHDISLASQSVERLARQLRALTTCACGSVRLPGPCSGFCDRDV